MQLIPEHYFILRSTEDGTRIEGPLSAAEVEKRITPDKYGDTYYGTPPLEFCDQVPDSDKGCWCRVGDGALLIIKGKIIVPKPKKTVTSWEIL